MAKSLFDKAKKSAPAKETKKDGKIRIAIKDENFYEKIERAEALQEQMKSDKAKFDMITDELRDCGKREWTKYYQKTGKNPGSVMLFQEKDENVSQLMYVPSDKYITINESRAEELRELYGEDVVTEETTFSFDSVMLEKYGEIISRLIEESVEIEERDKEKIITAKTTFNVSKGTIDKLSDYGDVEEVFEDVRPVISLKNIEVIKG